MNASNFKVFLAGKEIPIYVNYNVKLVGILRKLGLKADLLYKPQLHPINVLGSFEVVDSTNIVLHP